MSIKVQLPLLEATVVVVVVVNVVVPVKLIRCLYKAPEGYRWVYVGGWGGCVGGLVCTVVFI